MSHRRPREQKLTLILCAASGFAEHRGDTAFDSPRARTGEGAQSEEAPEGHGLSLLLTPLQPGRSINISCSERPHGKLQSPPSRMLRYFPLSAPASHQNCPGPSSKAPGAQQGTEGEGPAQSRGANSHLCTDSSAERAEGYSAGGRGKPGAFSAKTSNKAQDTQSETSSDAQTLLPHGQSYTHPSCSTTFFP